MGKQIQGIDQLGPLITDLDFAGFKAIAMACDSGATVPTSPIDGQWFLHSPTGRNVLMQYDDASASWINICSIGSMTMYVDKTDGTDDMNHGTGVDSDAFATVQYAIDRIPGIVGGNVAIYVNDEAYTETATVRGKSPSGNYAINIYGTLISIASGTQSGDGVQGTAETQGSFTDTGNLAGIANKLAYLDADGDYRLIDSTDGNTATIVGTFTSQPLQNENYVIYDWGTSINRIDNLDSKIMVIAYDVKLAGSSSISCLSQYSAQVRLYRCWQAGYILAQQYASLEAYTCYGSLSGSGVGAAYSQTFGYIRGSRCKFCNTHGSGHCVRAISARVLILDGTVLDGDSGNADDAVGIYAEGNAIVPIGNSITTGYCRIRNCDIGIYAFTGANVTGTANNQYSGNDTDETAIAASYGYID